MKRTLRVGILLTLGVCLLSNAYASGLSFHKRSPLTTKGDIYTFSTADDRLPISADNSVLIADSTTTLGVKWGPSSSSTLSSDITGIIGSNKGGTGLTSYTKGDLISPNASGNLAKLAVGSAGFILSTDSSTATGLVWVSRDTVLPLTTKGDTITFSTKPIALAVGANGTVLSADSSTATGLKWVAPPSGGGGTPGGSTTQIQYNSASAFAGATMVTTDGLAIRIGPLTSTLVSCDVNGPIRSVPFALTDGASIALDLSKSSFYTITLGGNRTLSNFTNGFPGCVFTLLVSQDASGNRFLGLGTAYKFGADVPSFDTSKTATTKDYIKFICSGTTSADVVGVSRGFR